MSKILNFPFNTIEYITDTLTLACFWRVEEDWIRITGVSSYRESPERYLKTSPTSTFKLTPHHSPLTSHHSPVTQGLLEKPPASRFKCSEGRATDRRLPRWDVCKSMKNAFSLLEWIMRLQLTKKKKSGGSFKGRQPDDEMATVCQCVHWVLTAVPEQTLPSPVSCGILNV